MALAKIQVEKIDPKTPWKRDKLERQKVAEYLTSVLASIRQPYVLSLHAPYGTGKSFFLECWKADLEGQGYKVVLFDAWATDFSNDPLSAFIASLKKQTEAEGADISERWITLAKKTAGFFRSKALPLVLKGLGRKLVGDEGVQEIIEGINLKEGEVVDALCSVAVEALSAQEVAEKSMEDFREYLAETAAALVKDQEEEKKKKLIIFVDELDRCKPSYAIEILEAIKHLFAVEGTVFVLAFDEDQMLETISNTYGLSNSGEGYLRKFIDWRFQLPEPEATNYCKFLLEQLFADIKAEPAKFAWATELVNGIAIIAETHGLTCREVERAISHANLVFRSQPSWDDQLMLPMGLMTALYIHNRSLAYGLAEDFLQAVEFIRTVEARLQSDYLGWRYERYFSLNSAPAIFMNDGIADQMFPHESGEGEPALPDYERQLQALYSTELNRNFRALRDAWSDPHDSVASVCLRHISGAEKYVLWQ